MKPTEKIDFVMPWVDGNDPVWQEELNSYKKVNENAARFRDWDNLRYWFRGVEKFTPWVNKIYFITYGHIPSWLNTENEKLVIVRHEDYIPKECLPTFNSHTIELNMWRIKGLQEKFVYFNDDVFITKNMQPDDFFDKNGLPRIKTSLAPLSCKNPTNVFENIIFNNMRLINKHFKSKEFIKKNIFKLLFSSFSDAVKNLLLIPFNSQNIIGFSTSHVANPFLKNSFEEVYKSEQAMIDNTSLDKFRTISNVNQYLILFWQIASGKYSNIHQRNFGQYFEIGNQTKKVQNAVSKQVYKLVCLNDVGVWTEEQFEECKEIVINAFEKILPEKSGFEI